MRTSKVVAKELEKIRLANGGILRPADVVNTARNKQSPLHGSFEWDDTKAAHQYRLVQARYLIRCTVDVVDDDSPPVHVYVSLEDDRKAGDSYRSLEDTMADPELRATLLDQALREAESWRSRYERLVELAPIADAITKVRGKNGKKPRRSPKKRRGTARRAG